MAARSYREALAGFSWNALWQLFDGDRRRLNIAHECVDRHAGRGTALRVQFADGRREEHDFEALAAWSSRFAHFLEREGIERGDRVAIMLEPSLPLYGLGLESGDRYFCPSSPAWGHGLWHGTIAPLALGIAVGAYAGRFDAGRVFEALGAFGIDNLAAAPTVYRMLRDSGVAALHPFRPRKLSYTGEPMDSNTFDWVERTWGLRPCGMYGSTEVG